MQEEIFNILLNKDEVTWQSMLYGLVKDMSPWDVDVSLLTKRYIEMLKRMKELDFKVSGKVVLAAALLLKIKSTKLVGEDIAEMDRLMSPEEFDEEAFYDELEAEHEVPVGDFGAYSLLPRTPQPRKRKVSVYDLVNSLQKALEVKDRRTLRNIRAVSIDPPRRKWDPARMIGGMYKKVVALFGIHKPLTFSKLVPSQSKEDKVLTFIPLLHLAHQDQRKIDLKQDAPFGEIEVVLKQ